MRTLASILLIALTTTSTDSIGAAKRHISHAVALPDATAGAGAQFFSAITLLPVRTFNRAVSYEHRDHQELPVGTRIYNIDGSTTIVRPGEVASTKQPPDVVIIPDESVLRVLRR